jgi:hypothetical protein
MNCNQQIQDDALVLSEILITDLHRIGMLLIQQKKHELNHFNNFYNIHV